MDLLGDPLIVKHLTQHEDLIQNNFDVPQDESPVHFILRQSNEFFINEQKIPSQRLITYYLPTLFASTKKACIICSKELKIKKNIKSVLYDDVLGSNDITIILKYCSGCKLMSLQPLLSNQRHNNHQHVKENAKPKSTPMQEIC